MHVHRRNAAPSARAVSNLGAALMSQPFGTFFPAAAWWTRDHRHPGIVRNRADGRVRRAGAVGRSRTGATEIKVGSTSVVVEQHPLWTNPSLAAWSSSMGASCVVTAARSTL